MSDTAIVPASVQVAAKRGFIRTTAQAYATSIPVGGISAATIIAVAENPSPLVIVANATAVVLSPLLAGLASYLSIISKGVPEAYTAGAVEAAQVAAGKLDDLESEVGPLSAPFTQPH